MSIDQVKGIGGLKVYTVLVYPIKRVASSLPDRFAVAEFTVDRAIKRFERCGMPSPILYVRSIAPMSRMTPPTLQRYKPVLSNMGSVYKLTDGFTWNHYSKEG